MGISSYVIGIVTGLVIASVGLETVVEILKESINEAIPILVGLV